MTDDVQADARQASGKRASFAQSEDDRRPNPINLQEIADRAERALAWIAPFQGKKANAAFRLAKADIPLLISELQKAREALECISSLSTQPHGQWAERWPEWEKHRLAMMAEREYRGVIVLNNLFGSIARQALSPAPAGSPPTSGGGDE